MEHIIRVCTNINKYLRYRFTYILSPPTNFVMMKCEMFFLKNFYVCLKQLTFLRFLRHFLHFLKTHNFLVLNSIKILFLSLIPLFTYYVELKSYHHYHDREWYLCQRGKMTGFYSHSLH